MFLEAGVVGTAAVSSASLSGGKGKCLTLSSSHASELEHLQLASKGEKARRDFLSGLQIKVSVGSFLCCFSSPNSSASPPLAHS